MAGHANGRWRVNVNTAPLSAILPVTTIADILSGRQSVYLSCRTGGVIALPIPYSTLYFYSTIDAACDTHFRSLLECVTLLSTRTHKYFAFCSCYPREMANLYCATCDQKKKTEKKFLIKFNSDDVARVGTSINNNIAMECFSLFVCERERERY